MIIKDKMFFHCISDFLCVYLQIQRELSEHTIKSYREVLNLFLGFICEDKILKLNDISIELIDSETISRFIEWLGNERGCKPLTQNHHLAVIRSFLEYASIRVPTWSKYYHEATLVPRKKTEKMLIVNHFSENALKAILEQPNTKKPNGHRDLFFMILLYDTGARDSELLFLKVDDVVTNAKAPYVYIHGKGKKVRTVPITIETLQHFRGYMNRFHKKPISGDFLFYVTQHGVKHQMSDDNAGRFIKKYSDSARKTCPEVPRKVTPHTFRHSRALSLYRKGMPLPLISEWLGHSQMETTLIYSYADTEMKRAAIQKATSEKPPLSINPVFEYETDELTLKRLYGLIN